MTDPSSYGARPLARREKEAASAADPVLPRHVHAALALDDEARHVALAHFRAQGGNLDRWQRRDLDLMAEAITAAEDALELRARGAWTAARRELRAIRRELEGAT